ncbi:Transmembrane O-methyltransferase [Anabarilius grahami]|uniref:catechol O-methyltransferase n=1 Tax=Anabarilius grahami TaxID=495550 RepID=A0A3N0YWA9_ANAGA|nr:Transmembrane O-methyltransferase [Anabarilius grahami]
MSLLVFSVPLLLVVAVMKALSRSPLSALCRQVYSGILKLSHRKVCVSSTHAFVFSNCTHGQAQSVLLTFDLHSTTHASSNIGPQKGQTLESVDALFNIPLIFYSVVTRPLVVVGAFLDEIVAREAPLRVLELGTHCGYASVRILRLLPPSGKLLTVELDPLTADRGEEIILVAGFKNQQVLHHRFHSVIE